MPKQSSEKPRPPASKPKANPFRAFTVKASGTMLSLRLNVGISQPVAEPDGLPDEQLSSYIGLINTCQPVTQIGERVVSALGIQKTLLRGREVYIVDIYLPNRIRFAGVPTQLVDDPEKDCVLGMDILACGDLAVTHTDGKTCFTFRVPPGGAIDFVEEHKRAHPGDLRGQPRTTTMVDRNQLCPCGSGKKHKNCCGKYH